MNRFLKDAIEIQDEIIFNRRLIHENAELGFELEKTVEFVETELKKYGYEPIKCGKAGISATVGSGEEVILLRADMDALPMCEETNLSFASKNGATHSCGHDAHTAMLLGAAKILKRYENELKGTVKFMFQPAEELLQGAKDMIENGILELPKVSAAFGQHIMSGEAENKIGHIYITKESASTSADAYTIKINGVQSHGSTPEKGVDAVIIACYIAIGLQTVLSREISANDKCVLLVGKIDGGVTVNTTSGYCELQISIRTANEKVRSFVNKRVKEISEGIAKTYRATVEIEHTMQAPSVYNNVKLSDEFIEYIKEIVGQDKVHIVNATNGTEDFAYISEKIPSVFVHLGAGSNEEGYFYNNHNPKFDIDESTLAKGVAIYCNVANEYLNKRVK